MLISSFASFFWPREGVNHTKLQEIHRKMVCHQHVLSIYVHHLIKQVNESSPGPTPTTKPKAKPKRKPETPSGDKPKKKAKTDQAEVKDELDPDVKEEVKNETA